MLEEQATHISGARQDEEQQQKVNLRQVVTKSLSMWLNLISSPRTKNNEKH